MNAHFVKVPRPEMYDIHLSCVIHNFKGQDNKQPIEKLSRCDA